MVKRIASAPGSSAGNRGHWPRAYPRWHSGRTMESSGAQASPGTARQIVPSTDDPLSPLNWAGTMWDATNSGSFSLAYDDGTFSASGTFSSSGNFGEMGMERNGLFVHHEEQNSNDSVAAVEQLLALPPQPANLNQLAATTINKNPGKFALLKGRVPVKFAH